VVIASSEITGTFVAEDTARVDVRYWWVGVLGVDTMGRSRLLPADSAEDVQFSVVRTPGGWKIAGPDLAVHVDVPTVLRIPSLSPEDRAGLRARLSQSR
jgi:hypothetical protein